MGYLSGWNASNRIKLTIDYTKVDGVLSDFPIHLNISVSSGIGSTDLTVVFDELTSDANRKKIAVTTSDGETQCYVEIERWSDVDEKAVLWVKAASVASDVGTILYLYYDSTQPDNTTYVGNTGDAAAQSVWDSNFKLVMHMAQDPNGDVADAIKDSTGNANHGTPGGTMLTEDLVDGKIGKGIDLEGTDDCIDIGDISMDFGTDGLTLEAIIKASDCATDREIIFRQDDLNSHFPTVYLRIDSTGHIKFVVRGQTNTASKIDITSTGADYDDNTFRYIVGVFDDANNSGIVLVNGISDGTNSSKTTTDINFGQAKLQLGRLYQEWVPNAENYFKDIIDEVRISNTTRSVAWIKATHYSNWDELVNFEIEAIISVQLTSPFLAVTSFQSKLNIQLTSPPLAVQTSISVGSIWPGLMVKLIESFLAETSGKSNLTIKIKPGPFEAISSLSINEPFLGYWVNLVESFEAVVSGQSNLKVSIVPGKFEAITSGQCDVGTFFKTIFKLISSLGDQSQNNTVNSFGEQAQNVISAALGLENKQLTKLDLSLGIQEIQKFLLRLCEGDPFISLQSLKNQLVYDKREIQKVLNIISNSVESIQAIPQTISLGGVASLQKLLLEIAEKDYVLGQQNLLQSLENLGVSYLSVEYDILLDGFSIKKSVTDVIISYREDSVHNSISIRSIDKELFWKCDPVINEGISRIEVQVGTRQIYFLLEKQTGDEKAFSFWGRSISAKEDVPYAEDLDYSLDEPKSAKAVVEEILIVSSLDWQCDDWILPTSFEFEGTPMEGISQIVNAIGAVVRCKDDGTILVRQRYPIRPINMNGTDVAVSYDRSHLTRLDYENFKGLRYNAVKVTGFTDDVGLPDMAVEESSPVMGDDVHVRVYWAGNKPSGGIATYVTDGDINILGEETSEEDEAETVTFMDGIASVSRPITSITNFEWIGDSGGNINYEKFSKDLEIANEAYRIGEITYKTTYSRYCVSNHDVEVLLALLTFGGESDVSVEVKMGIGDRPAPDLNLPLLTSQSIAVVAGTAWLDKNKYDKKKVVLETPYNDNVIDGVLVYVNNAEINCIGNFHVKDCNISIKGPRVINEIGILQCQV